MWGKAVLFCSRLSKLKIHPVASAVTAVLHYRCDSTDPPREAGVGRVEEEWGGVRGRRRRKAVGSQGNRWWRILAPVLFMESRTVKSVGQDVLCIVYVSLCVYVGRGLSLWHMNYNFTSCTLHLNGWTGLQMIIQSFIHHSLSPHTYTFTFSPSVFLSDWSWSDIVHYT